MKLAILQKLESSHTAITTEAYHNNTQSNNLFFQISLRLRQLIQLIPAGK